MGRHLKIKDLVPRKNAAYRQGYYTLLNPVKYIGDPMKIIFRSSWEKKFATYCDLHEQVVAWASEPMEVPYFHPFDGVMKPYNVDFYMKVKQLDGTFKQYIVEVKPSRQLKKPSPPSNRASTKQIVSYNNQVKTYLINLSKFTAAQKLAKDRGWEFIVVTEAFIFS